MEKPILSLLKQHNRAVHFFGLPGTYKTTLLLQIIREKLKNEVKTIYLIDTSGNFPLVRLKTLKDYLHNLVIFQPKILEETALILDDLDIQLLDKDSILFFHDIFRHVNLKEKTNIHLNSYILALIGKITQKIDFPIIFTNQARFFNNKVHPFLESLILHYIDLHILFEKTDDRRKIRLTLFEDNQIISQHEYAIDLKGFLIDWDK